MIGRAWSIPDDLLKRTDLDMTEKVLIAILDRLGACEKPIYPRQSWLAEKMGVSTRTIRRTLERLKEKGLVNYEGRRWKIAQYSLNGQLVLSSEDNVSSQSQDNVSSHNKHIQSKHIQIKEQPQKSTDQLWDEMIEPHTGQYSPAMIELFSNYWRQKNENGKKELWQMQRVFDIKRRLATWAKKDQQFNHERNARRQDAFRERNEQKREPAQGHSGLQSVEEVLRAKGINTYETQRA